MTQKTALLIIDIQQGMYDETRLPPLHKGKVLLNTTQSLLEIMRRQNAPIVYIQHCGPQGHPLEEGTPNCEIHSAITPQTKDVIVQKKTPDSFFETALQAELEKLGVKHLVVAGLQTEYCVDTTCRSAFSRGFDITLIADGHSTWNTATLSAEKIIQHHNDIIGSWFGKAIPLQEFTGSLTLISPKTLSLHPKTS